MKIIMGCVKKCRYALITIFSIALLLTINTFTFRDSTGMPREVQAETIDDSKKTILYSGTCGDENSDVTWELDNEGTLTLSGTGAVVDSYWSESFLSDYYLHRVKKVVIEEGITRLGDAAFFNAYNLKEVSFPDSLLEIGDQAFETCALETVTVPSNVREVGMEAFMMHSLTDILVEEDNQYFTSVDGVLYSKDKKVLVEYPGGRAEETYEIPEGTEKIGDGAFLELWKNPKNIIVARTVKELGTLAFGYMARNLEGVYFKGDCPVFPTTEFGKAFYYTTTKIYYPFGNSTWDNYMKIDTGNLDNSWQAWKVPGDIYSLEDSFVRLSFDTCTYDGTQKKPEVTVTYSSVKLTENVDYTVNYQNNVNPGTASVVIEGMGEYVGSTIKTFIIQPVSGGDEESDAGNIVNGDPIDSFQTTAPGDSSSSSNVSDRPTAIVEKKEEQIQSMQITGLSNKIAAGKKVQLTVTFTPSNVSNKNVIWTSSNPKIATVNQNGVVTFKKKSAGKSSIITATATDGSGAKAVFKLKSMKGVVKKVVISGAKKRTVKAGKTLKLKAKVTATKGANKMLRWTSSNTEYATVSASGKVKTKKAGKGKTVKITVMATDGSGKKQVVKVKIK